METGKLRSHLNKFDHRESDNYDCSASYFKTRCNALASDLFF